MSNYTIPYLVGNKPVRDHQYWPLIDSEIVDAYQLIVAELQTLLHIAWRVREWTISGGTMSFEWHTTPGNPATPLRSVSGSWDEFTMEMKRMLEDMSDTRDVTDERDILGPPTDSSISDWLTLRNVGVQGSTPGTWTSPTLPSFSGDVVGGFFGAAGTYDPDRKVFAPPFGLTGTALRAGNHPIVTFFAISSGELADDPSIDDAEGVITVIDPAGGSSFVIPIGIVGFDTVNLQGTGTVSDITVTPTRWWKFKNSLGEDVYDEYTGAEIADPFA